MGAALKIAEPAPHGVRAVPVGLIDANPGQPRQEFEPGPLQELAASIVAQGLIQPITVTPRGDRFMIVAGERRYRAHLLAGLKAIDCHVRADMSDRDVMLAAIIENAQRVGVSAMEEAVAFQKCLDMGMSAEELTRQLGLVQVWRIAERTSLLKLRPEYQALLRARQLKTSEGEEMARLSPEGQDRLFKAIRLGNCSTFAQLRLVSLSMRDAEAQPAMFEDEGPPPATELERHMVKGLERRMATLISVLRASTVDNEIVAVKRIAPDRAGTLADMFAAARGDMMRIESALRASAQAALV